MMLFFIPACILTVTLPEWRLSLFCPDVLVYVCAGIQLQPLTPRSMANPRDAFIHRSASVHVWHCRTSDH